MFVAAASTLSDFRVSGSSIQTTCAVAAADASGSQVAAAAPNQNATLDVAWRLLPS